MAKRKGGKNTKQQTYDINAGDQDAAPLKNRDETITDNEVERQCAAIRALRDVEIEQILTMIKLLRSYFSEPQLQIPVRQFFRENLPNVSIFESGKDGQYEVKWEDRDGNFSLSHADAVHASLLHRLSIAYPNYSSGIPMGGFEFSNKSVKTGHFATDKLQIRSLVLEEPSDLQAFKLKDGLQTPNMNNNRLSIGITPKTLRHPKCGEMLLSVHGSPLGIYKEDNMETIQETED